VERLKNAKKDHCDRGEGGLDCWVKKDGPEKKSTGGDSDPTGQQQVTSLDVRSKRANKTHGVRSMGIKAAKKDFGGKAVAGQVRMGKYRTAKGRGR